VDQSSWSSSLCKAVVSTVLIRLSLMTEFAIDLLGKFQITHNGQPLTTLSFPRSYVAK
jgi:hypothetical protein